MSTPAVASNGWVRGPVPSHKEQQPRRPDPAPPPRHPPGQGSADVSSWARPRPEQRSAGGPEGVPSSSAQFLHTTPVNPAPSNGPARQWAAAGRSPAGGGRDQLVTWVNAHGGAGATTFAAALGGADAGNRWPDLSLGQPGRIFLLARTHAAGLRAAGRAMKALHTGKHPAGIELLALVLVADAPGRLPLKLSRRVRVLCSATTTVTVPWIPAWRIGEPAGKAPQEIARLAALIRPGSAAKRDSR
ncbi:DUF6668 family protein [Streptomyces phaeochromogenes]|uniref:DUF6668 family protein n=1 Tax=Streptomyces phaeochromogenes TaxID=1923 RepID=UPI0033FA21AD